MKDEGISVMRATQILGCTYAWVYELIKRGYFTVVGTGKIRNGGSWGKIVSLKQVMEYKELKETTNNLKRAFAKSQGIQYFKAAHFTDNEEKTLRKAADIITNAVFLTDEQKTLSIKILELLEKAKKI